MIWRSARNHVARRSSFASKSGFIRRDTDPPASMRVIHPPVSRFSSSAAIRFRPPQVTGNEMRLSRPTGLRVVSARRKVNRSRLAGEERGA